ncbi:MAG: cytochrome P450 [Acidobacteria bacterium]|nr:cytochrome P450 [Acidobacteriota bacterium]
MSAPMEEKAAEPTALYAGRSLSSAEELDALTGECPQAVHAAKLAGGIEEAAPGVVVVRRMADILALNKSRHTVFGAPRPAGAGPDPMGLGGRHHSIPQAFEGAEHAKWRKMLDPLFSPKRVGQLEGQVRARAAELLDPLVERGGADAYAEWCEPLPSSIFLSIMGIPASELEHFLRYKNTILSGSISDRPKTIEERLAAFDDCDAWFAAEFDRRERLPDLGDDLIGWLMAAEVDGRRVTRDELHGICNLLMIAGLDTVAASLACILAHLARHPDRRKTILDDRSLWPSAIEEIMRFESPVTSGTRHVTADVELPSGTLKAGTQALVWWAAANLDPERFEDPLDVKLDRAPNPHIVFASGFHRCLGSHLARMELRAALDVWHDRIPDYAIPDGVELTYSFNPRAPHTLPLTW